MEVCLICSWHPAPSSSQSHHLLPQLTFASDLQTEPKKNHLSSIFWPTYQERRHFFLLLDCIMFLHFLSLSRPDCPFGETRKFPCKVQCRYTDCFYSIYFTATPGCLHLFQWLIHLQKFCYLHIKWITCASNTSAVTLLGLSAKKMIVFLSDLILFPIATCVTREKVWMGTMKK